MPSKSKCFFLAAYISRRYTTNFFDSRVQLSNLIISPGRENIAREISLQFSSVYTSEILHSIHTGAAPPLDLNSFSLFYSWYFRSGKMCNCFSIYDTRYFRKENILPRAILSIIAEYLLHDCCRIKGNNTMVD